MIGNLCHFHYHQQMSSSFLLSSIKKFAKSSFTKNGMLPSFNYLNNNNTRSSASTLSSLSPSHLSSSSSSLSSFSSVHLSNHKSGQIKSFIPVRYIRVGLSKSGSKYVETEFDKRWKNLSDEDKKELENEYEVYQKKDWKTISFDQKRALYTMAYGLPEEKNPNEAIYVTLGVAGIIAIAWFAFAGIRSLASPPSPTYNDEWYEETKKLMRKQKATPVDKSFDD